jgi:hypothetical protein
MSNLSRCALPIAALALLAACGGGGGGDSAAPLPPVISPAPVTASVDVAGAWHDYVTAPHSWTMRGQGTDKRAFDLTVVMKPGASATFPMTGSTGQTIAQSLRFTIDGANTVSSDGTLYFTNQTMIGVATTDGACAGARGAMPVLPSAASVGESGAMFVLEGYAGCTISGQKLGTTKFLWSIEKDAALTMFCITSQQQDANGASIGTEVDCMEANPNGTLGSKAKFTITRPDGNSITGRNY